MQVLVAATIASLLAIQATTVHGADNQIVFGISVDSSEGTLVGQPLDVHVKDPDGDQMYFKLINSVPPHDELFAIANETGQLSLLKSVAEDTKTLKYNLTVAVSDGKDDGNLNISVIVNLFSGSCEVCSMVIQEVHRTFDEMFESTLGNDLSAKHMMKHTNLSQVVLGVCERQTSLLNSNEYYHECKKILKHWNFVAGSFSGKAMKPNFGEMSTKKTYVRQLNLCNATFGFCTHDVDYASHKKLRKNSCKKCLAVAQDFYDENRRWQYKNSVELSIKSGKNPSAMTTNELRYELKSMGKQLNGLRPDLVKRLIEARISKFDEKGGKSKQIMMDRGKLATLLETYCISIPMRHPPTLSSILENKCDEMLEEYETEILDLLMSQGVTDGDTKSARLFARKLCGNDITDDCSAKKMKEKDNWWRSPWYSKDRSYSDDL